MQQYVIYLGLNRKDSYRFAVIESDNITKYIEDNKDTQIEKLKGIEFAHFNNKLFKSTSVLAITKITSFDKEEGIKYNNGIFPIAYWPNKDDRLLYQTLHSAIEKSIKSNKEGASKEYLDMLKPMKEKVFSKIPRNQRAFVIGEIINFLMRD